MIPFSEAEQTHRDSLARAVKSTAKPSGTRFEKILWVKENHQASRVDGVFLDAFTANMLVQIHDRLNEANQKMFLGLSMPKMILVGWKLSKGK